MSDVNLSRRCGNCGDAQRVVLGAVLAGLGAASGCLDVSINTAA
jgi:hypothetical protein